MADSLPVVVVLHKYFLWANRMRTHFDEVLPRFSMEKDWYEPEMMELNMYMSYWYGGLYVVIEGWKELGLQDETIDGLLNSPNVDLLRRYRNGAFHFQREYFDERFVGIMRDGVDSVTWVRSLNRAFGAYFLHWFKTSKADDAP